MISELFSNLNDPGISTEHLWDLPLSFQHPQQGWGWIEKAGLGCGLCYFRVGKQSSAKRRSQHSLRWPHLSPGDTWAQLTPGCLRGQHRETRQRTLDFINRSMVCSFWGEMFCSGLLREDLQPLDQPSSAVALPVNKKAFLAPFFTWWAQREALPGQG